MVELAWHALRCAATVRLLYRYLYVDGNSSVHASGSPSPSPLSSPSLDRHCGMPACRHWRDYNGGARAVADAAVVAGLVAIEPQPQTFSADAWYRRASTAANLSRTACGLDV